MIIEILEKVVWAIFAGAAGFIAGCFYGKKQKLQGRDKLLSLHAEREAAAGVLHRLADFLDTYAEDLSRVIFEDDDESNETDEDWTGSVYLGEIANQDRIANEDDTDLICSYVDEGILLKPENAVDLDAADLAEIEEALHGFNAG